MNFISELVSVAIFCDDSKVILFTIAVEIVSTMMSGLSLLLTGMAKWPTCNWRSEPRPQSNYQQLIIVSALCYKVNICDG